MVSHAVKFAASRLVGLRVTLSRCPIRHLTCLQLLPVSPMTSKSYQVMPWLTAGRLRYLLYWRTRQDRASLCTPTMWLAARSNWIHVYDPESNCEMHVLMHWSFIRFIFLIRPSVADCWGISQAGELSPLCFDLRHSSNRSKSRPNRLLNLFSLGCLLLLS